MTAAAAPALLDRIQHLFPRSRYSWRTATIVVCLSVAIAVALRAALEPLGQFYYLPMVPAVMITALLTNRVAVAAAIILSIAFNLTMVHREGVLDAAVNAALFA
ncbi:MAG: hypothetical protein ACRED4_08905, partial [Brevundimonas sp.]